MDIPAFYESAKEAHILSTMGNTDQQNSGGILAKAGKPRAGLSSLSRQDKGLPLQSQEDENGS